MTTGADLSVVRPSGTGILHHVRIERTDFAASMLADITGFVQAYPERIASLTLVCPPRLDPVPSGALGSRSFPDHCRRPGGTWDPAAPSRDEPSRSHRGLAPRVFCSAMVDTVADRTEDISTAVLDFLHPLDQSRGDSGRAPSRAPWQGSPITARGRTAAGAVAAQLGVLRMGAAAGTAQRPVSHGDAGWSCPGLSGRIWNRVATRRAI